MLHFVPTLLYNPHDRKFFHYNDCSKEPKSQLSNVLLPQLPTLCWHLLFLCHSPQADYWFSSQGQKNLFLFKFIYFNWRLITLQYYIGFAIHQHESTTGVHMFPILNPSSHLPPRTIPLGLLLVVCSSSFSPTCLAAQKSLSSQWWPMTGPWPSVSLCTIWPSWTGNSAPSCWRSAG